MCLAASFGCLAAQEATLQTLAQEASDPRAAADRQQGEALLREVLSRAFVEADPCGSGLIQPGEQLTQLLFAVAAQLTSLMVGATALSREGTTGGPCCCCWQQQPCAQPGCVQVLTGMGAWHMSWQLAGVRSRPISNRGLCLVALRQRTAAAEAGAGAYQQAQPLKHGT